jgi:hypothetical protein
MKMWQVMLLRIHKKHPDDNAVKHADVGMANLYCEIEAKL